MEKTNFHCFELMFARLYAVKKNKIQLPGAGSKSQKNKYNEKNEKDKPSLL